MTIGIYSLYWEEQDLIYIGQSQNIEARFRKHLNDLSKNKHSNYKVQNAFNSFGMPTTNIIEECNLNQLNTLEIVWQKEFNSLNSLDLINAGQVGQGILSNNSKYSKLQVLLTFRLLCNTTYSYTQISSITNVKECSVQDIANGSTHIWLREKYHKKYTKMIGKLPLRKQNRAGIGINNSQFGTMWIYSLTEKKSRKILKNSEIPIGWFKGRIMHFE